MYQHLLETVFSDSFSSFSKGNIQVSNIVYKKIFVKAEEDFWTLVEVSI